jgi:galactose mutarotase-like enzyme
MSQKSKVLKIMRETGEISRNECLRMYISRLGAIICDLKKDGMNIEAEWKDGDYVYKLLDKPTIIPYYVNGEIVSKKVIW